MSAPPVRPAAYGSVLAEGRADVSAQARVAERPRRRRWGGGPPLGADDHARDDVGDGGDADDTEEQFHGRILRKRGMKGTDRYHTPFFHTKKDPFRDPWFGELFGVTALRSRETFRTHHHGPLRSKAHGDGIIPGQSDCVLAYMIGQSTLRPNAVLRPMDDVISLVRRCSIRRFSYGYLVTTYSQSVVSPWFRLLRVTELRVPLPSMS